MPVGRTDHIPEPEGLMPTKISWTDESWNPVTGCTPVSEGCAHCYAKRMAGRFGGDFSTVTLHPDRLEIPLRWRKPRMVFVPSMGDLFHEDVDDFFITQVFGVMAQASQHTFQVLTKRPERMRNWVRQQTAWLESIANTFGRPGIAEVMPHIWLGVSVENQARADERYAFLRDTPAAVRFYSIEPLLGPIPKLPLDGISWVIVGGETGPGARLLVERCRHSYRGKGPLTETAAKELAADFREVYSGNSGLAHKAIVLGACPYGCAYTGWRPKPEALEWVRGIRDQCQAAGVSLWFKQWGPRAGQGTLLDGREWREMPRQEVRA